MNEIYLCWSDLDQNTVRLNQSDRAEPCCGSTLIWICENRKVLVQSGLKPRLRLQSETCGTPADDCTGDVKDEVGVFLSGARGPLQRRRRSFRVEGLILGCCTFLHGVGVLLRFSRQQDSRCSLLCHVCSWQLNSVGPRVCRARPNRTRTTPTKPPHLQSEPGVKPRCGGDQRAWTDRRCLTCGQQLHRRWRWRRRSPSRTRALCRGRSQEDTEPARCSPSAQLRGSHRSPGTPLINTQQQR